MCFLKVEKCVMIKDIKQTERTNNRKYALYGTEMVTNICQIRCKADPKF